MSYQVNGVCYSTVLAAHQAIASSQVGTVLNLGNSAQFLNVQAVTSTGIVFVLSPFSSGGSTSISITKTVQPVLQPCGLIETPDALVMAWGIVTAWIVTAAILHIKRGAHS
jgi:hypothetical protein